MVKPITDRIADLRAKQEKLATQLNTLAAKAKQEDRKRDTRRKIVVGAAMLAALEYEPTIAAELQRILTRFVSRDQDRDVVADLLGTHHPVSPGSVIGQAQLAEDALAACADETLRHPQMALPDRAEPSQQAS